MSSLRWPAEPYPGLRPFRVTAESDETLVFYGRNGHKDEVLSRLERHNMVFVTGPSGCGKSSLVRAGVLPMLRAGLLTKAGAEWRDIIMRPGISPISELAEALSSLQPELNQKLEAIVAQDVSGLWIAADMILGAGSKTPILLLIDQFEEIFGPKVPYGEADQLVRLIVRLYERPHPNLYVLITMRTDYLDDCAKFVGLSSAINATQFLTPILGLKDLVEAITRPAEDYGGKVDKPLLERLLADMRPGVGYDPDNLALLQHALQWLWRRACVRNGLELSPTPAIQSEHSITLDLSSYLEGGGLRGILNGHANQVAGRYRGDREATLEAVFKRLAERVPGGGYRRTPATIDDIAAAVGSSEGVSPVVHELALDDAGLLEIRNGVSNSTPLVDICHEALIRTWDRYKEWVDDEAEKLRFVRRITKDAVAWQQQGRREEELLRGSVLHFFSRRWQSLLPTPGWATRYTLAANRQEKLSNLIPLVENFLEQSNIVDKREEEKYEALRVQEATTRVRLARDRFIGASAMLAVIAAFFGYWWFVGQQQKREVTVGSFRVLALDALETRKDAPTALLWSLEGIRRSPSYGEIFEPLLFKSLQELHLKKIATANSSVSSVSFSPDLKLFLSTEQDGRIQIWRVEGGVLGQVPVAGAGAGFLRARWSADGRRILIAGREAVTILRTCSVPELQANYSGCKMQPEASPPVKIAFPSLITSALFSPDSKTLLIQSGPSFFQMSAGIYDLDDLEATRGAAQPRRTIADSTWAVGFSSDGDMLAVGGKDGNVSIFSGPNFDRTQTLERRNSAGVNQIWSLAFGRSDNELYSGYTDGTILKWDIKEDAPKEFAKQLGQVFQLSMSRDGEWLASSSDAGWVTLWKTDNPKRSIRLGPHLGPVWNFDLGQEGANWVIVGSGRSIYLWNRRGALSPNVELTVNEKQPASSLLAASDPEHYSFSADGVRYVVGRPAGHGNASVAAVTSNGEFIAIAIDEGPVLLYRSGGSEPRAVLRGPPRKWKALSFEGSQLAAYSEAGDRVSWPFFSSETALVDFAQQHVPVLGGEPMRLPGVLLCYLGSSSGGQACSPDVPGGTGDLRKRIENSGKP